MSIVNTHQLTRRYGQRMGVAAIDLNIGEGEIFGFLGPNGAGKTTTIRLLLGFLRPDAGRANICGLDCWHQSPQIKREVGYLPGDIRLYPWMTGKTALSIFGKVRGLDLTASGLDLAERFQLELNLCVSKMSRGMRQKLGIILALAHRPRLLILDEPTSGLDPLMQTALANCLREFASAGHTIFFSSHTLSEVEDLCDRVAIVRCGRIVADQQLQSLRAQAPRMVELVFKDAAAAESVRLPDFLKLVRRHGRQCSCELQGSTRPLIGWAHEKSIDDISISPPDLQNLFRRFYDATD